jgi:hypothetical protein
MASPLPLLPSAAASAPLHRPCVTFTGAGRQGHTWRIVGGTQFGWRRSSSLYALHTLYIDALRHPFMCVHTATHWQETAWAQGQFLARIAPGKSAVNAACSSSSVDAFSMRWYSGAMTGPTAADGVDGCHGRRETGCEDRHRTPYSTRIKCCHACLMAQKAAARLYGLQHHLSHI